MEGSRVCLNCSVPFSGGDLFCAQCGQKTATRRLSFHDIGHDLVHAFTHVDRGAFAVLKNLLVAPGKVARDYVDGRRRRHFNPFTLLVVVVSLASLAMATTGFVNFTQGNTPPNPVSAFLQRNINLIILLQVPLLALVSMGLFRASKLNFAEHLVLPAYASSLRSVFFMVVVLPAWLVFKLPQPWVVGVYIGIWALYYGFACSQFHAGHRAASFAKGMLTALFAQGVIMLLISAAFTIYFRLVYAR